MGVQDKPIDLLSKPLSLLTKQERRQRQEILQQESMLLKQQKKEREEEYKKRRAETQRQEKQDYLQKQLKLIMDNPNQTKEPTVELSQEGQIQLQKNKQFIKESGAFQGPNIVNQNQTIFFRVGYSGIALATVYTFVFAEMRAGKLCTFWSPIDDPNFIEEIASIELDDQMKSCLHPESLKYINQIGKFIIYGSKWGFLLDLNTLQDIYQGNLGDFWFNILKQKFFQEKFRTFAEFQQEEQSNHENLLKELKIKTTQDDEPFFSELLPFSKNMFSHQKQETGWMFSFENQRQITFPIDLEAVPLLDSGYYFYPDKPLQLLKKSQLKSKTYQMPGAILGSQIGSGKTLSIIALTSIGHEINNKKYQNCFNNYEELQNSKNNKKLIKHSSFIQNQQNQLISQKVENFLEEEVKNYEEEEEEKKEDYIEKTQFQDIQQKDQNKSLLQNAKIQNNLVQFSDEDQELSSEQERSEPEDPFFQNKQLENQVKNEDLSTVSFQQIKEGLILQKKQSHIERQQKQIFQQKINIYKQNFDAVYLPSLIVVTENILFQWKEEYTKFAPHLNVKVIEKVNDLKRVCLKLICGISGKKYSVFKNIDILIIHREILSQLYNMKICGNRQKEENIENFISKIENVNFKRVVFDEFHELTNAYKQNQKNYNEYNYNQFNINNIGQLYNQVKLIKREFTWGVTGTIENLDYIDDNKSMALLLNLPKSLYETKGLTFATEMKKQFVKNCIRSNPRCIQLPELQKQVIQCKQSTLQNLLYRGIINGKGVEKARQICSYFMNEYKFIQENLQNLNNNQNDDYNMNQFEFAIQTISSKLQADIEQAQKEYEFENIKHEKNPAYQIDKNIVQKYENLLGENNFYSDVLKLLNTDKFLFEQESTHQDLEVQENQKNVLGKQIAQIKQPKLTLMEPSLKMGNKYEYKFKINNLNSQNKLAIGIYRKYQEYKNALDKNAKENDLMINQNNNKVNSHYYTNEEIKELSQNGVNLKYQRLILFKENIMDDEFIYEFIFRINQQDGKNFLGIGICDKNIVENANFRHEKYLEVPEFEDEKKTIKFDRNKLLNHGLYMVRADGMIYSSHDIKINKYFKNINFSLNDTISMQINPKLGLIKIKNISQQTYFQFSYLEKVENKQNMFPFIALYSNKDEIQILETKKQRQLNSYVFDGFDLGHGAYMISAEGDLLSEHDEKLNKTFQNNFNFKKGDQIQVNVDLQENLVLFKNINNKSTYTLDIQNDTQFPFNIAFLMHDEQDNIECTDQAFVFECPLCFEEIGKEQMVLTNCLHQLCDTCYKQLNKKKNVTCPFCKQFIGDNQVLVQPIEKNKPKIPQKTKMDIVLENIKQVPDDEKIIIYTQFNSLTEHIAKLFDEINLNYLILTGQPSKINIKLNKFKNLDVKILIMSIEQAASGINITEANHIYFLHPIFGMLPEKAEITYAQCIGRAYRIGQQKPVNVKLFVSQYTLEAYELGPYLEDLFKEKQQKQN